MSVQAAPADFKLTREGDVWVATHVETGIASQGRDPNEAVAMTQEAVELSQQEHTPASAAEQAALRQQLNIDIDEDADSIDSPSGMP